MDPGYHLQARLMALMQNFKSFYWYCVAFIFTGGTPRAAARRCDTSSAVNHRRPLPRLDQTTFTIRSSGGYQIISFQDSPSVRQAKEARAVRQQREAQVIQQIKAGGSSSWTLMNRGTNLVTASHNTPLSGPRSSSGNKDRVQDIELTELNKKLQHCDNKDAVNRDKVGNKKSGKKDQPSKKNVVKKILKDAADNEDHIGNKDSTSDKDQFNNRECKMAKPSGNRMRRLESHEASSSRNVNDYKDLNSEYQNIYNDPKNKELKSNRLQSGTNDSTSKDRKSSRNSKEKTSLIPENDLAASNSRIRHTGREPTSSINLEKIKDKDSNKDNEKARGSRRKSSTGHPPRRQVVGQDDWMTVQTTAENTLKV